MSEKKKHKYKLNRRRIKIVVAGAISKLNILFGTVIFTSQQLDETSVIFTVLFSIYVVAAKSI